MKYNQKRFGNSPNLFYFCGMKNLIFILSTFVLLSSCSKDEDPTPTTSNNKPCNCGTIANDGIDTDPNNNTTCYWLEIRNDCSGNKKKFCFDQDVWMKSYVGSNFCVTNQTSW